jgi:hypothetical protein
VLYVHVYNSIVEEQARQVCENSILTNRRFQKDTSISFTKRKKSYEKKNLIFKNFRACLEIIQFLLNLLPIQLLGYRRIWVKIKNFLPLQMGLELECSISFRQPSVGIVLARPRFEDGARG